MSQSTKHILLIDDDEDEYFIFCEALGDLGLAISCSHLKFPTDALAVVQDCRPDMVFMDINMPVLNGLQCARLLKESANHTEIRIVIYSTTINDSVVRDSTGLGIAAYLKKCDTVENLKTELKKLFQAEKFID